MVPRVDPLGCDRSYPLMRLLLLRSLSLAGLLMSTAVARAAESADELAAAMSRRQSLFAANGAICHGATGDGVTTIYPPLAKSDWLAANRSAAIRAIVAGLGEEITVNGRGFRGQMPAIILDDAPVADVLTYVVNSWGNIGGRVTADNVAAVRALSSV